MKSAALAEPSDMSDDEEVPVPRLVPSRPAVPKSLDMVINAIVAINDKKGASIQAIKTYILAHYPTIDPSRLGSRLKNAIPKGLDEGLLVRPKNSETAGTSLIGRLKVDNAKMAALKKELKPKSSKATKTEKPKKLPKKAVSASPPKKTVAKKVAGEKKPKAKVTTKAAATKAKSPKTKSVKTKPPKTPKPKKPKTPKTPKTPASKTTKARAARTKTGKTLL